MHYLAARDSQAEFTLTDTYSKILCFFDTLSVGDKEVFLCKLNHNDENSQVKPINSKKATFARLKKHLSVFHNITHSQLRNITAYKQNNEKVSLETIVSHF